MEQNRTVVDAVALEVEAVDIRELEALEEGIAAGCSDSDV
jgi:hypothetical protein